MEMNPKNPMLICLFVAALIFLGSLSYAGGAILSGGGGEFFSAITLWLGSPRDSLGDIFQKLDGILEVQDIEAGYFPGKMVNSCQSLSAKGTTFTLSRDLTVEGGRTCIIINGEKITLDCGGHTIEGSWNDSCEESGCSSTGILIAGGKNISITNCSLSGLYQGISLGEWKGKRQGIMIAGNTIGDSYRGIFCPPNTDASGSSVFSNVLNRNINGISWYCDNGIIEGNRATENKFGIVVGGKMNILMENKASFNNLQYILPRDLPLGEQNIFDKSNTWGTKPINSLSPPQEPGKVKIGISSCKSLGRPAGLSPGIPVEYFLLQDISQVGTCFRISGNLIALDCQGYRIEETLGDTNYIGAEISSSATQSTVRNCHFAKFGWGIVVSGRDTLLEGNTIESANAGIFCKDYIRKGNMGLRTTAKGNTFIETKTDYSWDCPPLIPR
ncbi:hypothetical protein HYV84_08150 [Candidatus Woesearchaeota archaeon]|nr:hypothetical protein [Candidatus Woesearchaeota archaeon]